MACRLPAVYTELIRVVNSITCNSYFSRLCIYVYIQTCVKNIFTSLFCLSSRHNSRSMRSSSPDHHHHHSASRHRELPPPRGSSHWNHGWSNSSGDHHYSYDYDYGSTSHHYPRRNRHSARLNKPEIYMEDARKLKHSGDRTVYSVHINSHPCLNLSFFIQSSEIEKAHYYLDAALTYMTYCVCKEVCLCVYVCVSVCVYVCVCVCVVCV